MTDIDYPGEIRAALYKCHGLRAWELAIESKREDLLAYVTESGELPRDLWRRNGERVLSALPVVLPGVDDFYLDEMPSDADPHDITFNWARRDCNGVRFLHQITCPARIPLSKGLLMLHREDIATGREWGVRTIRNAASDFVQDARARNPGIHFG